MTLESIRPLQDKVLVKRVESQSTTDGGIYIPEIAREETAYGTVVAVGPGKLDNKGNWVNMNVKPGDKVYFTKNAVIEVMHEGEEHLMMKEERILLIETDKK